MDKKVEPFAVRRPPSPKFNVEVPPAEHRHEGTKKVEPPPCFKHTPINIEFGEGGSDNIESGEGGSTFLSTGSCLQLACSALARKRRPVWGLLLRRRRPWMEFKNATPFVTFDIRCSKEDVRTR